MRERFVAYLAWPAGGPQASRGRCFAILTALVVALLAPACARDGDRPPLREGIAGRAGTPRSVSPGAAPARPGTHRFALRHDGVEREYLVHVPRSVDPSRPLAVVFSFHGGGGNMMLQADDRYHGLVAKSESAGYLAVFPNGYSRMPGGRLATWNAGSCCGAAAQRGADDVGFVRAIVRELRSRYAVGPDRIFANGFSSGAMFAYRLACEMADTFRAIAAVAGTEGVADCRPGRPVSVLHMHARDDDHVPFDGGAGRASVTRGVDFVSVPQTIARWVRRNDCQTTPRRVLQQPGAFCERYEGCRGGARVMLCVAESGGHAWPGGIKITTGEPGPTAFSATELSWAFFSGR